MWRLTLKSSAATIVNAKQSLANTVHVVHTYKAGLTKCIDTIVDRFGSSGS